MFESEALIKGAKAYERRLDAKVRREAKRQGYIVRKIRKELFVGQNAQWFICDENNMLLSSEHGMSNLEALEWLTQSD